MQTSATTDETIFGSFLDSVYILSHSRNTVVSYRSGLKHFRKFVTKNYQCTVDELVAMIQDGRHDVYKIFNKFVMYLDKLGNGPKSIKLWIGSVKGYLRHSGIKIYSEDFKQLVKLPKTIRHREEPLTKEIILRLLRNLPIKLQTAVLVAAASAMRVGELIQLKISDIDFDSKPTRIRIRAETTKTRESRETYLTAEATNVLKDYLSRYLDWKDGETRENIKNQFVFGNSNPHVAESVLRCTLLYHVRKIPELNRLNENGVHLIHFHAFRKFFRTVVGDAVGRDYAEALMGHHFYLDTYYNLPEEKRREMYLKAEPYLTISDFVKIEKDLNKITEKQKEIEEEHFMLKQFLAKNYVGFPKSLARYGKEQNDN